MIINKKAVQKPVPTTLIKCTIGEFESRLVIEMTTYEC